MWRSPTSAAIDEPDLLVFRVDAVPNGQNAGYYRIGWDIDDYRSGPLNADGTVTAWRPWVAVPDWYFWENHQPAARGRQLRTGRPQSVAGCR